VSTAPGTTPTSKVQCGARSIPEVQVSNRIPSFERQWAVLLSFGQTSCTEVMVMLSRPRKPLLKMFRP
jgi:hypothetical protein